MRADTVITRLLGVQPRSIASRRAEHLPWTSRTEQLGGEGLPFVGARRAGKREHISSGPPRARVRVLADLLLRRWRSRGPHGCCCCRRGGGRRERLGSRGDADAASTEPRGQERVLWPAGVRIDAGWRKIDRGRPDSRREQPCAPLERKQCRVCETAPAPTETHVAFATCAHDAPIDAWRTQRIGVVA